MLRSIKLSLLQFSRSAGVFRVAEESRWRGRQLLILCYHGISLDDEHEWAPDLFMSPAAFESRLELLRRRECNVLSLDEGVRRLYDGSLPPRSVVMTFDDGTFDFHERAWPLLSAYRMPATVYLTTYYCDRNLPVFPLILSYLLWKRRGSVRAAPPWLGQDLLDTRSRESRKKAQDMVLRNATHLSTVEKDDLAARLADALDVDYEEIRRKRILQIMNADEVTQLAAAGVDFQLHTHRHRSPLDRDGYLREVTQNRQRIEALSGSTPEHFCYPSGVCLPQFGPWLADAGVVSATTCEPGIANVNSKPLRLPRVLDHSGMTQLEFEAWLTGVGTFIPRRRDNASGKVRRNTHREAKAISGGR